MADHQHRLERIRGHFKDAREELYALPAEEREGYEGGLARLDEVIAYADVVLGATDAGLISTNAFTLVQSAAASISNDPQAALGDAETHADALLDALALLPGAHESPQRFEALRAEVDAEVERLHAFRSEVDRWTSDVKRQFDDQAAMDKRLAEVEQRIAKHRRALDDQTARQTKVFAESEQQRAAEFEAQLEGFRTELARAQVQALEEVDERAAEIRRMESECATFVETIALGGTSELYRRQGRRQRLAAEILRGMTVLAALGAVALALLATSETEPAAESLIAILFASLLLAGLAAYLARQSARHRAREEHAAALQFELAAFGPFIEGLTPEQREEERVILARKIFGNGTPSTPEENHAPRSFLLRHRRTEAAPGEPEGTRANPSLDSPPAHNGDVAERSGSGAGRNGKAGVATPL